MGEEAKANGRNNKQHHIKYIDGYLPAFLVFSYGCRFVYVLLLIRKGIWMEESHKALADNI